MTGSSELLQVPTRLVWKSHLLDCTRARPGVESRSRLTPSNAGGTGSNLHGDGLKVQTSRLDIANMTGSAGDGIGLGE